ncbi:hypothetical protein H0H92_010656 [Tricholoma furcatifolium]|nr:hypothetical protein H0H92_010656 [Tricholoma furcatifolium]
MMSNALSQDTFAAKDFSALSVAPSTAFTTTTSSGSIVPGPGALSGKAIRALGKATLRGAEFVIIRAMLAIIAARFPLADTSVHAANGKEVDKMYDDLLELSRRDMYANDIRERALQILLAQIGSRSFKSRWLKKPSIIQAYRSALPAWEIHSHIPFVDFLSRLVQTFQPFRISQIPIHAAIFDFLLHVFMVNFYDPLVETEQGAIDRTSTLYSACKSLLTSLSDAPDSMILLRSHPLRAICSTSLFFTTAVGPERLKQRLDIWDSTWREVVVLRLHVILHMLQDDLRTFDEPTIHDICLDSLELAG